jgi:hypothetical protein
VENRENTKQTEIGGIDGKVSGGRWQVAEKTTLWIYTYNLPPESFPNVPYSLSARRLRL